MLQNYKRKHLFFKTEAAENESIFHICVSRGLFQLLYFKHQKYLKGDCKKGGGARLFFDQEGQTDLQSI